MFTMRTALLGIATTFAVCVLAPAQAQEIHFNRDIRPIFANHCVKCHGRDAHNRQAGLRLDLQAESLRKLPSGSRAVVPYKVNRSELIRRITSKDPARRMPPAEFGRPLSAMQVQSLRKWIAAGARWQRHWAYTVPQRPPLPAIRRHDWPRNPIDYFVLARLERVGLSPEPPAKLHYLAKRVAFGLTGLPLPTDRLQRFLKDRRPGAYRDLLNRLLSHPGYGERMATHWLDLARYADTHGYHTDSHRDMWRWRDWVIKAFNQNMPFDQFTIWQLAGDLLPQPTLDMKLASGFHRNTMLMFENGAIAAEYLNEYIVDRVVTTGTVWLGQTLECCRCHDHKYDPLTQRDFYRLYAYFNGINERGLDGQTGNAAPVIKAPTYLQQQRLERWQKRYQALTRSLVKRRTLVKSQVARWESKLRGGKARLSGPPTDSLLHLAFDETAGTKATDQRNPDKPAKIVGQSLFLSGKFANALLFNGSTRVEVARRSDLHKLRQLTVGVWMFPTVAERMCIVSHRDAAGNAFELTMKGNQLTVRWAARKQSKVVEFGFAAPIRGNEWQHVALGISKLDAVRPQIELYFDGKLVKRQSVQTLEESATGKQASQLTVGASWHTTKNFRGLIDDFQLFGRKLSRQEVERLAGSDPIRAILAIESGRRSVAQRNKVVSYYLNNVDKVAMGWLAEQREIARQRDELRRQLPTAMVMQQMKQPRPTYVLGRGDYQLRRERVYPGTPGVLPKLSAAQPDRLGLARWLISRRNPLTARVVVNRIWQMHFGTGLVRTAEDFGTRGEWPSHPDLLDWLAVEFIDSGWDLQHIHRLILDSATYRQSSRAAAVKRRRDPDNRLLARGPRLRLTAEMVRDQALQKSGLYVQRLFGPGVYPYQPPGLWKAVSYNPREYTAQVYEVGTGASLYRRSVYTFWKRSVPPPAMSILGAPNREVCTVRRRGTNTPLQALLLLNDTTFVEAARVLAQRSLSQKPRQAAVERARKLFRQVVGRPTRPIETRILMQTQIDLHREYRRQPLAAHKLCRVGATPLDKSVSQVDLATWTTVVSMLLNLDETITRN